MKSNNLKLILGITLLFSSCGFEPSEESSEKSLTYASLKVNGHDSSLSYDLTNVDKCAFDSTSDVITANFSDISGKSDLRLKLTGVIGDSGTKTCIQSSSNLRDTEGCSVLFKIPNTEADSSGSDHYAMYQTDSVPDAFNYDGTCKISWEKTASFF